MTLKKPKISELPSVVLSKYSEVLSKSSELASQTSSAAGVLSRLKGKQSVHNPQTVSIVEDCTLIALFFLGNNGRSSSSSSSTVIQTHELQ